MAAAVTWHANVVRTQSSARGKLGLSERGDGRKFKGKLAISRKRRGIGPRLKVTINH